MQLCVVEWWEGGREAVGGAFPCKLVRKVVSVWEVVEW